MKKIITLLCVGLLSLPVLADDTFEVMEEPQNLRDQCYQQVSKAINLNAVRERLRSYKTARGTDYYDVYRLFRSHRLSSDNFQPLKQLADDIQLSATMVIGRCVHFFGDMDTSTSETSKKVAWVSANEMLQVDTLPKIEQFEKEFVAFVKSKYGMR